MQVELTTYETYQGVLGLEGAACQELALRAVEHLFYTSNVDKITRQAAKNICDRCVANPECLDRAINGPYMTEGFVAGLTATAINLGRRWRRYELGLFDTPPERPRPEWLPQTPATEAVESARIMDDPDEAVAV